MPAWVVPAVIAGAQIISGLLGQRKQSKENRKLAEFQADANDAYQEKQNQYNTPASQMQRYQDARLNPHLIYGQGTPGNQSSPQTYPETGKTDYTLNTQAMNNIVPLANQTMLAQSQVQATDAKTRQTGILSELNKLQIRVMEKNPLLNTEGFKATIDSLKASAEIKASESTTKKLIADWSSGEQRFNIDGVEMHGPAGALKLETELKTLLQKYQLGTQDAAIKAEIIKSKDFQNSILEIQKRFMTDAEVTPQHILQFVQILLMKLL